MQISNSDRLALYISLHNTCFLFNHHICIEIFALQIQLHILFDFVRRTMKCSLSLWKRKTQPNHGRMHCLGRVKSIQLADFPLSQARRTPNYLFFWIRTPHFRQENLVIAGFPRTTGKRASSQHQQLLTCGLGQIAKPSSTPSWLTAQAILITKQQVCLHLKIFPALQLEY